MEDFNQIKNDSDSAYQRADIERLKEALKRSYTERFLMTTRLYKIQKTMDRLTITHKPFNKK